MNKILNAAVVGGAALAVGLLPAASASAATAPTPVPVPVVVPSAPAMPTSPGTTTHPHAPSHRTPSHHRTPGKHRPGKPGTAKPGKPDPSMPGAGNAATGKPGSGKAGSGKAHGKTGAGKPGSGKAGAGRTGAGKAGSGAGKAGKAGKTGRAGKAGGGKSGGGKAGSGKAGSGSPGAGPAGGARPTAGRLPAPAQRIIGGTDAGKAPWATQVIWDDRGFECSGAAIAPQWVLTARHCVSPGGMTVLIGSTKLGEGTRVTVDETKVDPAGDLALLHLADSVDTGYLPLADHDPKVGSINQIYGWGKTAPDSGPAEQLRTARVKVTSVDCVDAQEGRAICSTGIDGMAFNGDSGGPEIADGAEVGVCSTGDDQAKSQQYASVAANRDWVREVANV